MGCTESSNQGSRKRPGLQIARDESAYGGAQREFKVVLLGDAGVGKSSITQRFCHDKFSEAYEVTIGGAYLQRVVQVKPGQTIKLHLWDTSGEERFKSMAALYYRDANAIILVYDVTDIRSFNSIQEYWIKELENKKKDDNVVLGMLGNKCDVDPRQRVVTVDMGKKFSDNNKLLFAETSAKVGTGIPDFFQGIAEELHKRYVR